MINILPIIFFVIVTGEVDQGFNRLKRQMPFCADGVSRATAGCFPNLTCNRGFQCQTSNRLCCPPPKSVPSIPLCSSGQQAIASCFNNRRCNGGFACENNLCCRTCPNNASSSGTCDQPTRQCPNPNTHCVNGLCCPKPMPITSSCPNNALSVGPCLDGTSCFSANAACINGQCCPVCPNNAIFSGSCATQWCSSGICISGFCCSSTATMRPDIENPTASQTVAPSAALTVAPTNGTSVISTIATTTAPSVASTPDSDDSCENTSPEIVLTSTTLQQSQNINSTSVESTLTTAAGTTPPTTTTIPPITIPDAMTTVTIPITVTKLANATTLLIVAPTITIEASTVSSVPTIQALTVTNATTASETTTQELAVVNTTTAWLVTTQTAVVANTTAASATILQAPKAGLVMVKRQIGSQQHISERVHCPVGQVRIGPCLSPNNFCPFGYKCYRNTCCGLDVKRHL